MHTPPEVAALGARYLGTYLLGAPLIFGFFAVDAAFRAAGDTRTPFVLLLASVAVTLVLDPVLILGLGAVPRARHRGRRDRDDLHAQRSRSSLGLAILGAPRRAARSGGPTCGVLGAVVRIGLPTAVTGVVFSLIYVVRHAHGDAVRHAGARRARHRASRGELAVHDRRRLRRGDGGDRRAEPRRRPDRPRRARGVDRRSAFCSVFGVLACVVELLVPERFAAIFTTIPR